jgi:hypothetical protein
MRNLKKSRITSTPRICNYFLDHLPLTARLLQALDLAPYEVERLGDGRYSLKDGEGIEATFRLIHRDGPERVYFFKGSYRPFPRVEIRGKGIVWMRYRLRGEDMLEAGGLAYFRADHRAVHYVSKLLDPVIGRMVDEKIRKIMEGAITLAELSMKDPAGFCEEIEATGRIGEEDLKAFRKAFCRRKGRMAAPVAY